MARITKASAAERANYDGVYPLHGWVAHEGHRLAVEDLRCWGPDDPHWEVIAPEGMLFVPNGTSTLLGATQADLIERVECNTLEPIDGELARHML